MSAVKRIGMIIVSVGLYTVLAILGWGGIAAFFASPARTTLVIAMFALACVAYFAGGNLSPGVREDRGNRWVLTVFSVLGVLAAYFPAYTDRKDFWTIDGDVI